MVDVPQDSRMQKLLQLTEENNKLLRKMHRAQQWASVFRAIYWIVIIGLIAGSFYFIQPFLSQTLSVYQGLVGTSEALEGVGGQIPGLGNLSELLGGLGGE